MDPYLMDFVTRARADIINI